MKNTSKKLIELTEEYDFTMKNEFDIQSISNTEDNESIEKGFHLF